MYLHLVYYTEFSATPAREYKFSLKRHCPKVNKRGEERGGRAVTAASPWPTSYPASLWPVPHLWNWKTTAPPSGRSWGHTRHRVPDTVSHDPALEPIWWQTLLRLHWTTPNASSGLGIRHRFPCGASLHHGSTASVTVPATLHFIHSPDFHSERQRPRKAPHLYILGNFREKGNQDRRSGVERTGRQAALITSLEFTCVQNLKKITRNL